MKFRKLKPLHGLAATRARLGLSQRQLAEQFCIPYSTIALAETGRRSLPAAASLKIAQLEIKMAAAAAATTHLPSWENNMDWPVQKFIGRRELHCHEQLYKLSNKLGSMTELHEKLQPQLRLLDTMLENESGEKENRLRSYLQIQRHRIVKQLSKCSRTAQTLLRNKIALLGAESHMNRIVKQQMGS